jgi:hypothetical protein
MQQAEYRRTNGESGLIDTNRIYITSHFMGGYGPWDAIRYPNSLAAGVPVCGGGDTTKAASLTTIHIWEFHPAGSFTFAGTIKINAFLHAGRYY